jgi:hypothetical protein
MNGEYGGKGFKQSNGEKRTKDTKHSKHTKTRNLNNPGSCVLTLPVGICLSGSLRH